MALPKFEICEDGDVGDVTVSAGLFREIVFISMCGFYLIERDGILVNVSMIPLRHPLPVVIAASSLRREEPDFRFARLLCLTNRFSMDKDRVRRNE